MHSEIKIETDMENSYVCMHTAIYAIIAINAVLWKIVSTDAKFLHKFSEPHFLTGFFFVYLKFRRI